MYNFGLILLVALPIVAEAQPDFSGLWQLDVDEHQDVYGEIRVVHQTEKELSVTMVDYGIAWIGGAFREVVNIMPWTFRFDRWGPRRGPADSKQPRTRSTWSGDTLVLEKSTFSGAGDFLWKWDLNGDRIVLQETARSAPFLRKKPSELALEPFVPKKKPESSLDSRSTRIVVGVTGDLDAILVKCPEQACTLVYFDDGRRSHSRALPQGETFTVPLGVEVHVQPAIGVPIR